MIHCWKVLQKSYFALSMNVIFTLLQKLVFFWLNLTLIFVGPLLIVAKWRPPLLFFLSLALVPGETFKIRGLWNSDLGFLTSLTHLSEMPSAFLAKSKPNLVSNQGRQKGFFLGKPNASFLSLQQFTSQNLVNMSTGPPINRIIGLSRSFLSFGFGFGLGHLIF